MENKEYNANLTELYSNLQKEDSGFTVSIDEFAGDMQDVNKRKQLWSSLKEIDNGFTVGFDEFSNDIGFPTDGVTKPQEQEPNLPFAQYKQEPQQQEPQQQEQQPVRLGDIDTSGFDGVPTATSTRGVGKVDMQDNKEIPLLDLNEVKKEDIPGRLKYTKQGRTAKGVLDYLQQEFEKSEDYKTIIDGINEESKGKIEELRDSYLKNDTFAKDIIRQIANAKSEEEQTRLYERLDEDFRSKNGRYIDGIMNLANASYGNRYEGALKKFVSSDDVYRGMYAEAEKMSDSESRKELNIEADSLLESFGKKKMQKQGEYDNAIKERNRGIKEHSVDEFENLSYDHRNYAFAQNIVKDAKENLNTPKDNGTFGVATWNFTQGMGKSVVDISNWLLGIPDLVQNKRTMDILEKYDRGEKLTESEEAVMDALVYKFNTDVMSAESSHSWYNAGKQVGEMVPFFASIALTGGMSGAAKAAGNATDKLVMRALNKRLISSVEKKIASRYGKEYATEAFVGRMVQGVENGTIKHWTNVLSNLAGKTVQGAINQGLVAPVQMLLSPVGWNGVIEEAYIPRVKGKDFNGNYIVDKSDLLSLGDALKSQMIEFQTEQAGGYASDVFGIANNIILGGRRSPFLRVAKKVGDVLFGNTPLQRYTLMSGVFIESGEEWLGAVERRAAGLMTDEQFEDFATLDNQWKMMVSFMPSMIIMGGASIATDNCKSAKSEVRDILSKHGMMSEADGLIDVATNGTAEDYENAYRGIIKKAGLSREDALKINMDVAKIRAYTNAYGEYRHRSINNAVSENEVQMFADKREELRKNIESAKDVMGNNDGNTYVGEVTLDNGEVKQGSYIFGSFSVREDGSISSPTGFVYYADEKNPETRLPISAESVKITMQDKTSDVIDTAVEEAMERLNNTIDAVMEFGSRDRNGNVKPTEDVVYVLDENGEPMRNENGEFYTTKVTDINETKGTLKYMVEGMGEYEVTTGEALKKLISKKVYDTKQSIVEEEERLKAIERERLERAKRNAPKTKLVEQDVDEQTVTNKTKEEAIDIINSGSGEAIGMRFLSRSGVMYEIIGVDNRKYTIRKLFNEGVSTENPTKEENFRTKTKEWIFRNGSNFQTVRTEKVKKMVEVELTPEERNKQLMEDINRENEQIEKAKEKKSNSRKASLDALTQKLIKENKFNKDGTPDFDKMTADDKIAYADLTMEGDAAVADVRKRLAKRQANLKAHNEKLEKMNADDNVTDGAISNEEKEIERIKADITAYENYIAEKEKSMAEEKAEEEKVAKEQQERIDEEQRLIKEEEEQKALEAQRAELTAKIADYVMASAEKLKLDTNSIVVLSSERDIPEGSQAKKEVQQGYVVKGWYEPKEDKVYILASTNESEADGLKTLVHEYLIHKKLKNTLDSNTWNNLREKVWNSMSKKNQEEFLSYITGRDKKLYEGNISNAKFLDDSTLDNKRLAAEEYIASRAEDLSSMIDVENENKAKKNSLLAKIAGSFRGWLKNTADIKLDYTDAEIMRDIQESYGVEQTPQDTSNDNAMFRKEKIKREGFTKSHGNGKVIGLINKAIFNYTDSGHYLYLMERKAKKLGVEIDPSLSPYRNYALIGSQANRLSDVFINDIAKKYINSAAKICGMHLTDDIYGLWIESNEEGYGKTEQDKNSDMYEHQLLMFYMLAKDALEVRKINIEDKKESYKWRSISPILKRLGITDEVIKQTIEKHNIEEEAKASEDSNYIKDIWNFDLNDEDEMLSAKYAVLQDFVDRYENAVKENSNSKEDIISDLWNGVKSMTDYYQNLEYDCGLIVEDFKKIMQRRQFYVPHRGSEEDYASDDSDYKLNYTGNGKNLIELTSDKNGKEEREDVSFDPMAEMVKIGVNSINRSMQNKFALNSLLPFVQKYSEKVEGDSKEDEAHNKFADYINNIFGTINDTPFALNSTKYNATKNLLIEQFGISANAKGQSSVQHYLEVRDGKNNGVYMLWFKDEAFADAMGSHRGTSSEWGGVMNYIPVINRAMAQAYTRFNPVFAYRNFIKDFKTGVVYGSIDYGAKFAGYFARDVVKNSRIFKDIVLGANSKLTQEFERALNLGIATGYHTFRTIPELRAHIVELEKLAMEKRDSYNKNVKNKEFAQRYLNVFSEDYLFNEFFSRFVEFGELLIRFSAFTAAKRIGKSDTEAAFIAKDNTVNLSQHGYKTTEMGKLFVFFNATMKGVLKMNKSFADHPIKTSIALMSHIILGFLSFWWLSSGTDDDDDSMYMLSDYERYNNFIIPLYTEEGYKERKAKSEDGTASRFFVKIPVSHDLGAIGFKTGGVIYDLCRGRMGAGEAAKRILTGIVNEMPQLVDMSYTTRNGLEMMVNFAPSAVRPVLDLMANKNFTGGTITKVKYSDQQKYAMPEYMLAKDKYTFARVVSQFLFLGFSDWNEPVSKFDANGESNIFIANVNPDAIRYLENQYTPQFKMWRDMFDFGVKFSNAKQLDTSDISLISGLVGSFNDEYRRNRTAQTYYNELRDITSRFIENEEFNKAHLVNESMDGLNKSSYEQLLEFIRSNNLTPVSAGKSIYEAYDDALESLETLERINDANRSRLGSGEDDEVLKETIKSYDNIVQGTKDQLYELARKMAFYYWTIRYYSNGFRNDLLDE